MKIRVSALLLALFWCVTAAASTTPPAVTKALEAAVQNPLRSAAHKARDRYRHPLKTLEFFGLRPDMTVIEVLPEGGWYTEILAPFLHDHGHLIEATIPTNSRNPFLHKMAQRYRAKLAAHPDVYGHIRLEPFAPPDYMALGAPDSADRVLTFRNMHDLIYSNVHGETTGFFLRRFLRNAYQVLKPGGVLGIVSHRANPDTPVSKSHLMGRLPQAYLIHQAERAGFKLLASSEINANPKDKRTMPVWYLPPSLSQGKKNREHYKAIGEADNMTLKFLKPKPTGQ